MITGNCFLFMYNRDSHDKYGYINLPVYKRKARERNETEKCYKYMLVMAMTMIMALGLIA